MERMQAQAQSTSDKKDLEHKMENEKRDRLLEKKELEQKMERMEAQAQVTLDKKDLEQKTSATGGRYFAVATLRAARIG
jgi:hypothetical protein